MGDVADQRPRRVPGQLRIGIQGNDIFDRDEDGRVADPLGKRRSTIASQQRIELFQFAALALIAHPHAFIRVPYPRPVKQIKNARSVIPISRVKSFDGRTGKREQVLVARLRLLGRVVKIRQQGKKQVGVPIAEIAYFQGLRQIGNVLRLAQQGRHHNHRPMIGRNTL
jgi:ABC-type uncharacterized transport system substrate-binding protein